MNPTLKRVGKRLIRRMADFLADQSTVGNPAVFEREVFPEIAALDDAWPTIRAEVDAIMRHIESLPRLQDISPEQARIATDDRWRSFVLYGFGYKSDKNCALCPETTRLIEAVPDLESAWLSILLPGYRVPRHKGITRGIVTALYGVQVPEKRDMCAIRIGDTVHPYEPGRSIVFDDTLPHEIWNDTDEPRVVLIVDYRRPMRPLGRLFNAAFLAIFKQTGYVREARQRFAEWEAAFHAGLEQREIAPLD